MNKKIKKIIAIILSVIMIASAMPIAFAEETETVGGVISEDMYGNPEGDGRITIIDGNSEDIEYDYEIRYGETITVEVNSEETTIVKFAPETSGKYCFKAQSDELDTYCYMYEKNLDESIMMADDENGTDFVIEYEFVSGVNYYFEINTYSEGTNEFDISIGCGHTFENGVCGVCGEICDHTEIGTLGYCACGDVFTGKDINDGNEFELENKSYNDTFWFRFIPEVSGTYSFRSVSENADPDCILYNADNEYLKQNYDVNGMDFDLVYNLTSGETYYFNAYNCYDEGAFKVILSRLTHTADDGSVHYDFEITEKTYSNCTEHGYTEGVYCNECEEFISGHKEYPLDEENHVDDDWNEICDLCDAEIIYEDEICRHICHSEKWFFAMIWRIANFFHSIFGISPECECGEYHYLTGTVY